MQNNTGVRLSSCLTHIVNLHQDAPTAGAGKHIVFGSEDEDDDEDKQQTSSDVTTSKKTLFQNSQSEDEATGDENNTRKGTVSEELLI